MRIDYEIKLGFKDVMIRPKRSTLKSRSQVDLERMNMARSNFHRLWDAAKQKCLGHIVNIPSSCCIQNPLANPIPTAFPCFFHHGIPLQVFIDLFPGDCVTYT